jgi:polyisoprenyl-phosphate glycosyltransferase
MKTITIVIPLLDEEENIPTLYNRLNKTTLELDYDFNFLIVDDGSSDSTLENLLAIQKKDPRLKIVKLSRSWGHQNAFNAGLDHAEGDAIVLMDGDLEDPPELICEFIKKWEDGNDVVYAVKESRQRSLFDRCMFALFYKLMQRFSDIKVEYQSGIFSLIDKKVLHYLNSCREKNKYYAGLRSFVGFKQTGIFFHREERYAGKPKQTFRKLANDGLNAFFSFSFLPIRLLTYFGLLLLGINSIFSIVLIIGKMGDFQFWFFRQLHELPGWTSIILLMLFLLSVQIIFLGILGEYIARIFDEVRNRPNYIVDKVFNSQDE